MSYTFNKSSHVKSNPDFFIFGQLFVQRYSLSVDYFPIVKDGHVTYHGNILIETSTTESTLLRKILLLFFFIALIVIILLAAMKLHQMKLHRLKQHEKLYTKIFNRIIEANPELKDKDVNLGDIYNYLHVDHVSRRSVDDTDYLDLQFNPAAQFDKFKKGQSQQMPLNLLFPETTRELNYLKRRVIMNSNAPKPVG